MQGGFVVFWAFRIIITLVYVFQKKVPVNPNQWQLERLSQIICTLFFYTKNIWYKH
jgi:hypothetical protein